MEEKNALVPAVNQEIIEASGVNLLLQQIRPQWQAKNLIQRVTRLVLVDPSSACERIFNASIHDLREKIIIAGFDIATEAAKQNKLPPVTKPEDVENYSTYNTIELAYRMGLLSRPEWRRLLRVYDIRKDLEHEDDEYEAGVEDCVYIFKTCVDVVLSRDPIQLLKLTDVKEIVDQPVPVTISQSLLEDYKGAPQPRQLEIYRFLIGTALNEKHPDIVRQNCYNVLGVLRDITEAQVLIESATDFIGKIGRRTPSLLEARVAFAAGILPYLKKTQLSELFGNFLDQMKRTGYAFCNYDKHGELLRNFKEIGGLDHCPDSIAEQALEWLILCYVGEPGGYGTYGRYRKVFYSDIGAPLALQLINACNKDLSSMIKKLEKSSESVKRACHDEYVARRFQNILDLFKE